MGSGSAGMAYFVNFVFFAIVILSLMVNFNSKFIEVSKLGLNSKSIGLVNFVLAFIILIIIFFLPEGRTQMKFVLPTLIIFGKFLMVSIPIVIGYYFINKK